MYTVVAILEVMSLHGYLTGSGAASHRHLKIKIQLLQQVRSKRLTTYRNLRKYFLGNNTLALLFLASYHPVAYAQASHWFWGVLEGNILAQTSQLLLPFSTRFGVGLVRYLSRRKIANFWTQAELRGCLTHRI